MRFLPCLITATSGTRAVKLVLPCWFGFVCSSSDMDDLKEDYYFNYIPQWEKEKGIEVDWKTHNCVMSVVLTFSCLDANVSRFLARWELFPSAFNLLAILVRFGGEGVHLSRISELLAVSRANVTGLVDVLARKNLVERVASTKDRRVRLARLTPDGRRLIDEILPEYYELNRGMCDDLTVEEGELLVKMLRQIRSRIANNADVPAAEPSLES